MEKQYWLSSPETSDLFERLAEETFAFLLPDYGFVISRVAKDGYGARILFCNSTTGVELNYEPGELRIWTLIYRLKNGTIPENILTPIPGEQSQHFYLEDIIAATNPHLADSNVYKDSGRIPADAIITENFLRAKLQVIAACLIEFAKGLLEGNFLIFEKAQTLLEARVQEASRRIHGPERQP